jgi:hypothetical protein
MVFAVIGQIGEDGGGTRIAKPEGEIMLALVRLLQPGGPDLGTTDEDSVTGSVVVGPVGL